MERARLVAVCLGFLGLTLSQQPGLVVADTKLDLAVDPLGFLARALHLWEPEGFAGQVQNQAYGYAFPMGPFFALGHALGLPGWVTQRLWMALLLSLAFLGAVSLARRLGIGSPHARLLGGLAYALAPRMVTGLGATSVEMLPLALAPWVLVPLVAGARGGSPRRAALLSGLAVFCVGGVNAVATSAVLPLAVLYLLTRPAGPRRRRLMAWWAAAVALATAWWVGPLLLLGRYSPDFLDLIETADTSTSTTDLVSTLRGTTQWLPYLSGPQGPVWPAGWSLVYEALPALATVVLAAAGLFGLARRDLRDRTWLVLGVLAGLVLVGMGHLGVVQGLLAEPLHELLDGPLAPLRNVHKFDPVLRLPLVLGLTHLCGVLLRRAGEAADTGTPAAPVEASPAPRAARASRRVRTAQAAVVVLVLGLLTVAWPAVAGRLTSPGGFQEVPAYWEQTADWLADQQPVGRALLLPASSFGTYAWGSPADEPIQPLAETPWEVRNAVPLTPEGHIRMLDAVEERLAQGQGSAGLAAFLARSGISHLVVRNDLDHGAARATRPALVLQALRDSPGITRVATFGPRFPSVTSLFGRALDAFLTPRRPAVEVYAVDDPAPRVYTTPLSDAVTVAGGPDGLLALADRGLLGDRPALLTDGLAPATGGTLVSDAQLRRERSFGQILGGESAGLTAEDPLRLDGPARDYLYPGWEHGESVVRIQGARISAASSAGDADSFGGARTEAHPAAAVDGDPSTAWRPAVRLGERPVWWRIETERLITADEVMVQLVDDPDGQAPRGFVVRTDSGEHTVALADTDEPQWLPLPEGVTRSVTLEATGGAGGGPAAGLALAEVAVPGIRVERTVITPRVDGPVTAFAFDAANPAAGGCVGDPRGRPRCSAALVHGPEEAAGLDRTFTLDRPASYDVTVTAVPRAGKALDDLIAATARPLGPEVTATSTAVPDPRGAVEAAVDGDAKTTWVAAASDPRPSLRLSWLRPQTIDRLRLTTAADTAASAPAAVTISAGTLERTVTLDEDGVAEFPALVTSTLELSFPLLNEVTSFDPYTRSVTTLGVGVSELELSGLPAADPRTPVALPCGEGPAVEVDGQRYDTSLETTLAGLRTLTPVELRFCDGDDSTGQLMPGAHRFLAASTETFAIDAATLVRPGASGGAGESVRSELETSRWGDEERVLQVGTRSEPTLLVIPENTNRGWAATLDGQPLAARTVDGWQQGYLLPAGPAGEVTLEFTPGTSYRAALAGGAAAALVLVCALLVPARRPLPPPTGHRRRAGVVAGLAGVAALTLVGGVVALAVLAGTAGLAVLAGPGRFVLLRRLAAGGMVTAGLVAFAVEAEAGETVAQVVALVALSGLLGSLLPAWRGRSATRPRHRRSGRSSTA